MTRRDIRVRGWTGRRAIAHATTAAAAVVLLAVLAACSAGTKAPGEQGNGNRAKAAGTVSTRPVSATRAATSLATSRPTPKPTPPRPAPQKPAALPVAPPDSGARPQTSAVPKTTDTAFANAVHDIWLAVRTGDPEYALPAFFPEKAYEQVKAIAAPGYDWKYRLWYDFTLDLAAVHKLVKPDATLIKVIVPTQYAVWVPAGACYNSVGYWHAPGARVVYRQDGVTRSFGIASFISWRGDWYLIHFGAVVRSGAYGIVDDPEVGPGEPGPPGNC